MKKKVPFRFVALFGLALLILALFAAACGQEETGAPEENNANEQANEPNDATADESEGSGEGAENSEDAATASGGGEYPVDTIEVVVPAGAGGDTDFNARTLGKYLPDELGVDMVVTNIGGAGGTTGTKEVFDADPDGSKVLFFHNSMLLNSILGLADYTITDFALAGIAVLDEGNGFFVNAQSEYEDLNDLIEAAKANPGGISIATEVGGFTHLQLLALQEETGIELNIVDVGGAADKMAALQGGHIDVIPIQYGSAKEYIDAGEFRTLGILAADKVDLMPDVPTFKDQGVDISFEKFFFYAFPPETPQEVVDMFSQAVQNVVENNEDYRAEAENFYVSPTYMSPDEATTYIQETEAYYEELLEGVEVQ